LINRDRINTDRFFIRITGGDRGKLLVGIWFSISRRLNERIRARQHASQRLSKSDSTGEHAEIRTKYGESVVNELKGA